MPTARVFLAAAALGGKIYALGGSLDANGGTQTAAVEVYDPVTDSWTAGAPLPVAEQLSAAAAVNGKLYAFGGFVAGVGVRGDTYEYDPVAKTWATRTAMPVARDQAPAVVVDQAPAAVAGQALGTMADGLAYVLGGSTDCHCRAIDTAESYKPAPFIPPPAPCIRLTKTDNRTVVAPGESLAYLIRVANCGALPVAVTTSDDFRETGLLGGLWCRGAGCRPSIADDLRDTVTVPIGGETIYMVTGQVPFGRSVLQNKACAAVAGLALQCQTDVNRVMHPTPPPGIPALGPTALGAFAILLAALAYSRIRGRRAGGR